MLKSQRYLKQLFFNDIYFWIFCLIFPPDYDKVLSKHIHIIHIYSNDMHFSDILTDFSLNYNKVQDFLL